MPHGAGCPIHRACCDEWEELPQYLGEVTQSEGPAFVRAKNVSCLRARLQPATKMPRRRRFRSAESRNGARSAE
jgi:hypothetical protein